MLQVHNGDSVQHLLYHSIYIRYDELLSLLFVQYFLVYQNMSFYLIPIEYVTVSYADDLKCIPKVKCECSNVVLDCMQEHDHIGCNSKIFYV